MAASGNGELAGDRGEDALDLVAKPNQDRNGDDGNKSQDQGVLDEGLTFPGSLLAAGLFLGFIQLLSFYSEIRPSLAPKEDPF